MLCSEAQLAHNLLWPRTGINSDRLRATPGDRESNCSEIDYDPSEFCLRVRSAKTNEVRVIPLTNVLSVTPLDKPAAKKGKAEQ